MSAFDFQNKVECRDWILGADGNVVRNPWHSPKREPRLHQLSHPRLHPSDYHERRGDTSQHAEEEDNERSVSQTQAKVKRSEHAGRDPKILFRTGLGDSTTVDGTGLIPFSSKPESRSR